MLELCTTDDPFQMLGSHLHQIERRLFFTSSSRATYGVPSTTRPAAQRDSPAAHRATQGSQPALRISSTDAMLPLPHCQCVQKATPRPRICDSRTRRYAILAAPVAATSESLSPILHIRVDEGSAADVMHSVSRDVRLLPPRHSGWPMEPT